MPFPRKKTRMEIEKTFEKCLNLRQARQIPECARPGRSNVLCPSVRVIQGSARMRTLLRPGRDCLKS
jgi:hypothetical protein